MTRPVFVPSRAAAMHAQQRRIVAHAPWAEPFPKVGVEIKNKCSTTRHTRGKISSSGSEDHNGSTSHVFTSVIADSFYNGRDS